MSKLKINAARRILAADANSWFESLTEEQQKQYLELHPDSKYGSGGAHKEVEDKKIKEKPVMEAPKKKEEKDEVEIKKEPLVRDTQPESEDKQSKTKQDEVEKKHGEVSKKDIHSFAHSEEAEPHSEARRSFGAMIKAKAKGVVKHLKDEVKEASLAGIAVGKLASRKKLTHEEKHALKATAVRLVIVCGALAIGGGLAAAASEGIKAVAKELADDFISHGLINVAEKTMMHSSLYELLTAGDLSDKGLETMTQAMAAYMATSKNFQKILADGSKDKESSEPAVMNSLLSE